MKVKITIERAGRPVPSIPKIRYFITSGTWGKRLFKWYVDEGRVLQVVVEPGKERGGKLNCVGIYEITVNTLQSNYIWKLDKGGRMGPYRITKETTEKLFNHYRELVIQKLKQF